MSKEKGKPKSSSLFFQPYLRINDGNKNLYRKLFGFSWLFFFMAVFQTFLLLISLFHFIVPLIPDWEVNSKYSLIWIIAAGMVFSYYGFLVYLPKLIINSSKERVTVKSTYSLIFRVLLVYPKSTFRREARIKCAAKYDLDNKKSIFPSIILYFFIVLILAEIGVSVYLNQVNDEHVFLFTRCAVFFFSISFGIVIWYFSFEYKLQDIMRFKYI